MNIITDEELIELGFEKYQINFVRRCIDNGLTVQQSCNSIARQVRRLSPPNCREDTIEYKVSWSIGIVKDIWKHLKPNDSTESSICNF